MWRLFCFACLFASVCPGSIDWRHGEEAHLVVSPKSELDRYSAGQLAAYFTAVLGKPAVVVDSLNRVPARRPAILLVHTGDKMPVRVAPPEGSPEAFAIASGVVGGRQVLVVAGATDQGLKRAIYRVILTSRQLGGGLQIPEGKTAEKPWIPEREYAICPWVPQHVRGAFVNPNADNRLDLWRYSKDQLANYVAMFDRFGFSGVQLLETSYSYSVMGSPEAFQDRQRAVARLAHARGQNVSLWVWAAEFNGYGWVDPDVVYQPRPGMNAFDDPLVRRGFEKYYDHYAALAPDIDQLIGHFYDPGRLTNREDVFRYMRLLEQKFRARNPRVRMAIDAWAAGKDFLQQLMDRGFTDYTLLAMSMPNLVKPEQRNALHTEAKRLGLQVGVWGWYTTEYETDQLASMYVNAELLQDFYRQVRDGAARILPIRYWSEMEAHHLNNIWSMYAAAQLLWNPDRNPGDILAELAYAIGGPVNGPKLLEAVKLIQDVRSGPTWNTYWWTLPTYRLGTANPRQDLRRAEASLTALRTMQPDKAFVPQIPLPFPPETFVELMLPHLEQIRAFAQFRIQLDSGQVPVWNPIPEYNTWIGTFGQPEARMQGILIHKLDQKTGTKHDEPAWVLLRDADRLIQKIQNVQKGRHDELRFRAREMNEFYWDAEKYNARLNFLVSAGAVEKIDTDLYRLPNWQELVCASGKSGCN